MKKENGSPMGLYTLGIAALFIAGFFLLVVFGAQSYRNTVKSQSDNMRGRSLLSYLATTVKAYDERGALSVQSGAVGQILSIADGDTGYSLRIYLNDGLLLEDYAPSDAELSPAGAQVIGESRIFSVDTLDGGLIRISTDAGSVLLRLRSEGGDKA